MDYIVKIKISLIKIHKKSNCILTLSVKLIKKKLPRLMVGIINDVYNIVTSNKLG